MSLGQVNTGLSKGKVSPALKTLTTDKLWEGEAEKWSEVRSSSFKVMKHALRFQVEFTVPLLDTKAEVLQAHPFKFWNVSATDLRLCHYRYAGPRYVLANLSNGCYMGLDSDWINYESVEGHPCNADDARQSVQLFDLKRPFHSERCVDKFVADSDDIQVHRANGFMKVYCFGHHIVVNGHNHTCPKHVFEIPETDSFELNGHAHEARVKETVLINPHEMSINREIGRQFRVGRLQTEPVNMTLLDQSLGLLNKLATKAGVPITLRTDFRPGTGVFKGLFAVVGNIWETTFRSLVQPLLNVLWWIMWIGIAGAIIFIIITVSPLVNFALMIVRPFMRLIANAAEAASPPARSTYTKERIV